MDDEDRKEYGRGITLAAVGLPLAYTVNMMSSAVFEMILNGFSWKQIIVFLVHGVGTLLFIELLSHLVENYRKVKNFTFFQLTKDYYLEKRGSKKH